MKKNKNESLIACKMSIGHQLRFSLHANGTEIVRLINVNYETNQLESIGELSRSRCHLCHAIHGHVLGAALSRTACAYEKREQHDLIKIFI